MGYLIYDKDTAGTENLETSSAMVMIIGSFSVYAVSQWL
jgi:hypothetical protein